MYQTFTSSRTLEFAVGIDVKYPRRFGNDMLDLIQKYPYPCSHCLNGLSLYMKKGRKTRYKSGYLSDGVNLLKLVRAVGIWECSIRSKYSKHEWFPDPN